MNLHVQVNSTSYYSCQATHHFQIKNITYIIIFFKLNSNKFNRALKSSSLDNHMDFENFATTAGTLHVRTQQK